MNCFKNLKHKRGFLPLPTLSLKCFLERIINTIRECSHSKLSHDLFSGSKKVQQELARPGALERFCDDGAQAERVRAVFAGLYALDEDDKYELVMANPENFVIKPQREGGGQFVVIIHTFNQYIYMNSRFQLLNATVTGNSNNNVSSN